MSNSSSAYEVVTGQSCHKGMDSFYQEIAIKVVCMKNRLQTRLFLFPLVLLLLLLLLSLWCSRKWMPGPFKESCSEWIEQKMRRKRERDRETERERCNIHISSEMIRESGDVDWSGRPKEKRKGKKKMANTKQNPDNFQRQQKRKHGSREGKGLIQMDSDIFL